MIRAIIFDLDGVIVQSEEAHIEAEKQTFLKYGIEVSAEELHRYTGATAKIMFTEMISKYRLKTSYGEMFKVKQKILFKLLETDAEPTAGVIPLLRELRANGILLAVASSSTREQIDYVLRKLNITSLFDVLVGAEDVTQSKPDPEIFLTVASRFRVEPCECLVIEDAKLGVEAAKRAGMKCLGFRNPSSGNQNLSGADMVTNSFTTTSMSRLLSV